MEANSSPRRLMTAGQMRAAAGVPETYEPAADEPGRIAFLHRQIAAALSELGEPQPETPAPVRNAIYLLRTALASR